MKKMLILPIQFCQWRCLNDIERLQEKLIYTRLFHDQRYTSQFLFLMWRRWLFLSNHGNELMDGIYFVTGAYHVLTHLVFFRQFSRATYVQFWVSYNIVPYLGNFTYFVFIGFLLFQPKSRKHCCLVCFYCNNTDAKIFCFPMLKIIFRKRKNWRILTNIMTHIIFSDNSNFRRSFCNILSIFIMQNTYRSNNLIQILNSFFQT